MSDGEGTAKAQRFCSDCGVSLVRLPIPHVVRSCGECGASMHIAEAAPGGGLQMQKGDRFVVPSEVFTFSLKPKKGVHFFRTGIPIYLQQMLSHGAAAKAQDLAELAKEYKDLADSILKHSSLLAPFDPDDQEQIDIAFDLLKDKPMSREWHAFNMAAFAEMGLEAVSNGDAAKSGWALHRATLAHSLTMVTEQVFEETIWNGYLANKTIHEAKASADHVPGEEAALKALEPLFRRLDEATLHTWIESGLPIGPRIGVKELPERTIAALAKYHLAEFQRRRDEIARGVADKRALSDLRIKWAGVGIAGTGAVVALLKALGWL